MQYGGYVRIVLVGLCVLMGLSAHAQKEATNWYFGTQAGFSFATGNPTPLLTSGLSGGFASATWSDPRTGELLFYSNAERVWNRQHRVMAHGDSLLGFRNVTQGALALPVPGEVAQYYLFTLGLPNVGGGRDNAAGLSYSRIDMRLAAGLGDVLPKDKNRPLSGAFAGQLTAVPHTNGRDYWVLAREYATSVFRVYRVDPQGVALAYASTLGPPPSDGTQTNDNQGYLKASPDGRHVAFSAAGDQPLGMVDFDAATGTFSHYVNLGTLLSAGGLSFSPDNTKLYVENYSVVLGRPDRLKRNVISQYDLAAGNDAAVAASGLSIVADNPDTNVRADAQGVGASYALQLGPDGRLYGNCGYTDPDAPLVPNQSNLFVIRFPNRRGFACDVRYQSFTFGSSAVDPAFPNFMQSTFNGLEAVSDSSTVCAGLALVLFPNPAAQSFQARVPTTCFAPYQLTLYDALGRLVYQTQVGTALSGAVNIRFLAAGGYVVKAQSPTQTSTSKLVKN